MKKILGLDLGTTSIGWALVNEAENINETSEIIKLGVRVNPLSSDEITDFEKGNPLSVNADRTLKRGARRNLQRFKLRRKNLIETLLKNKVIQSESILTEIGSNSTFETLSLRAKAAKERVEKEEFARILLSINKKRGYKSSRKAKSEEEGTLIDGMSVAKHLYENNFTPGQYVYQLLLENKKYIPDFYQSDLKSEFLKIWNFQKEFYTEILTDELFQNLEGKSKNQTWAICKEPFKITGITQKGSASQKKLEKYKWRSEALESKVDLEILAIVFQEINNDLNKSSGYLGAIGDRSKKLYFNKITVGQYLYRQIELNRHTSLKNQVFYRQDYLDEFEQIWETQAKYHTELTPSLKEELRDIIIFYQRKLKSQKGLISICEFEQKTIEVTVEDKVKKKTIGPRVVPKSSPVFQEFKIWQVLNNLSFTPIKETPTDLFKKEFPEEVLTLDQKKLIFEELNTRGKLKNTDILKLLKLKTKDWKCNFESIEGNNTNQAIYNVLQQISENEGHGFDWNKKNASEIKEELKATLPEIGVNPNILDFDINADNFEQQASYQLWHLLYSAEDDTKISKQDEAIYGKTSVSLKKKLHLKFGIPVKYTALFANISLQPDYGNLSARAIRKIMPHLQDGIEYSQACVLAGYNHSNSITKEENLKRALKEKLELLPKNSLRNPVVEKILNQLVNVVNQIIDSYGKPDEIRIELARELKKSAKQRKEMTVGIAAATKRNEGVKKTLQKAPFNILNPTKNDVTRYRLYQELETNGYKTLYTNQYIAPNKLFSKEIDIEHIIPKAKLFDDSFSNKTLAFRTVNLTKSNMTSYDFIAEKYNDDLENYVLRVKNLYDNGVISKGKYSKLLMKESNLADGFIERDLKNTQYIAKKAKNMLQEVVRNVVPTTGSITDKLREDWDLINVMKELNLPKYRQLGLTVLEERKNGNKVEQIIDWSKRNDHRHHAMDALAVAFTTHNHIQYINNLNSSRDEESSSEYAKKSKKEINLFSIRNKITKNYDQKNGGKKRKFIPPLTNFRAEAKKHIEGILISFKTKNKVATKNINKTKKQGGYHVQKAKTPRGQLHKETVYGRSKKEIVKQEKIGTSFTIDKINTVTQPEYRTLLLKKITQFNNDPKKAFGGKNAPSKTPIYLANGKQMPLTVTTKTYQDVYTIRKEITPDLKIEKIVDAKIKALLYQRVEAFNGDKKAAFSNLDNNPIWLNKEKGIAIKRVTISGVSNVEALHDKRDYFGNLILDAEGHTQPVDFVSTGNNHHVAIYKDEKGKLQEQVVSLFDAIARVNQDLPIVNKDYNKDKGWEFLFTLKQNELFIFPTDTFNPEGIDLLNENNYALISPHLFRVQKISSLLSGLWFRHHLETTVSVNKSLKDTTYKVIQSLSKIENIIKVRTNHLGNIVQIGEY
ncbi:type II CRISPR RNA-guided endonuclease Cas9 [Pseudotamlana carrageenivorans]|uniref:CRISPR-associated endonuclease Cas9 n=1 Tax=Pseudotamlana carrageenivorans TaxID=2069432 RepID=A0A2I7SGU3_9FLAO|nr:type II CRISPR RNA-guided endonuclease Cas9 [Tamlana carrageenivorans]AUS05054.1 type II CRISPR RNA-guided endonuclease Cas9 [Tamlana carrageenivorans]